MFSAKVKLSGLLAGVQSGNVDGYRVLCSQLWTALANNGVVILDCDEITFNDVSSGIEASDAFFSSDMATKRAASGAWSGEGYSKRGGCEELLTTRLGMRAAPGSRHPAQRKQLEAACCRLESLARCVLRALCRCPQLQLPPSALEGLLEEEGEALLQGAPSNCTLTASSASADLPASSPACSPRDNHGVLTLFASSDQQWLAVEGLQGSSWTGVPLGPGQVAVVVGHSLSYALGGALRPRRHRLYPQRPPEALCSAATLVSAHCGSRRVGLVYELRFRPGAPLSAPDILARGAGTGAQAAAAAVPGHMARPRYVSELVEELEAGGGAGAPPPPAAEVQGFGAGGQVAARQGGVGVATDPAVPAAAPAAPSVGQPRPRDAAGTVEEEGPQRKAPRQGVQMPAASAVGPRRQAHSQAPVRQQVQPPVQPGSSPSQVASMTIALVDEAGNEVQFKVRGHTKLSKVLSVYADRKGQAPSELRLTWQGAAVGGEATPAELGMSEGAKLQVQVLQAEPVLLRLVIAKAMGPVWTEELGRQQPLDVLLLRVAAKLGWASPGQGIFIWRGQHLVWGSGRTIADVGITEAAPVLVARATAKR